MANRCDKPAVLSLTIADSGQYRVADKSPSNRDWATPVLKPQDGGVLGYLGTKPKSQDGARGNVHRVCFGLLDEMSLGVVHTITRLASSRMRQDATNMPLLARSTHCVVFFTRFYATSHHFLAAWSSEPGKTSPERLRRAETHVFLVNGFSRSFLPIPHGMSCKCPTPLAS